MKLFVEPDPPPATITSANDPLIAEKAHRAFGPFDSARYTLFDEDTFDVFIIVGDWRQIIDPPIAAVLTEADPRIMDCSPGGFDPRDFEEMDFDVRYGSFCPVADPPMAEILVEADPA